MTSGRARPGMTLIELIVTLAMLGLLFGVVAVAFPRDEPATAPSVGSDAARARTDAIRRGTPVLVHTLAGASSWTVIGHPDGRVLVDSAGQRRWQLHGGTDAP